MKNENIDPGKRWGIAWRAGGMSIGRDDWLFLAQVLSAYRVRTVLEFGCGLSTLLIATMVERIVSYDTNRQWADRIRKIAGGNIWIRSWNGKVFHRNKDESFDLAFVDGPKGGENRQASIRWAARCADMVMVHDACRTPETILQERYLAGDGFLRIVTGGNTVKNRDLCALWIHEEKWSQL